MSTRQRSIGAKIDELRAELEAVRQKCSFLSLTCLVTMVALLFPASAGVLRYVVLGGLFLFVGILLLSFLFSAIRRIRRRLALNAAVRASRQGALRVLEDS